MLRRILLALPTLLIISFLAFGLGKCAPGDPVVNVFGEEIYHSLDPAQQAKQYRNNAVRLGLERPLFYGNLSAAAYPDTLWRIFPLDRRARLEKLIGQTGRWPDVQAYDQAVSGWVRAVEATPARLMPTGQLLQELPLLIRADKVEWVDSVITRIRYQVNELPPPTDSTLQTAWEQEKNTLQKAIKPLIAANAALQLPKTYRSLRMPRWHWYGFDNQYHHWLSGFVRGDLGLTRRRMNVWDDLQASFFTTLTINVIAIFLAYLIAIPLGVGMAQKKGGFLDRWAKKGLFFIYAMPIFWLGGLLIMLAHTPWGNSLLPSVYFDIQDAWQPGKTSLWEWWLANASKCLLPILILMLHALGVLTLQMRSGMLGALEQDYIRTARAKGVGEEEVYWSHAFRNALFPIITVFASILPAVFTGSLVVEALFGFPGMGNKTFEAYLGKDLPLLSAIMMVAAALTILGNLLADLLYAWADPRVRFAKENG